MRLSTFLTEEMAQILTQWDAFARSLGPAADAMSNLALRDHARPMLQAIALDIERIDVSDPAAGPASGEASTAAADDTAATTHGILRQLSGFSLPQLTAEFFALRATVLRLWLPHVRHVAAGTAKEISRFNESIDLALTESVVAYAEQASITQDKLLEADRYVAILDALPAHVAMLGADGTIIAVNGAWRQHSDDNRGCVDPGDGPGVNYLDVCDRARGPLANEAAQVASGIRAVLAGDAPRFAIEYACHAPDEQRWYQLNVTPLAGGVVVMHLDITERKTAQAALVDSEQLFAGAFEHAPIGVALLAPEGRWLRVNRVLCELLGYSEAQLLARSFQDITHPDDLQPDLDSLRRLMAGEIASYQMEKRYIDARGEILPIALSVTLVRNSDDTPRFVIAQMQDIRERRRAQVEIEQAMQRLSQAQRIGRIGDWACDLATGEVTWSPQIFAIFGRDPLRAAPRLFEESAALFEPASEAMNREMLAHAIATGEMQEYDLAARRESGEALALHAVVVPIRDAQGNVFRLYGTVQDISERKHAEEQSRQLAQRLTTTLNSITDAFLTMDREWRFTFLNDEAVRLLARPREELLGQVAWTAFPEARDSRFEQEYHRALAENATATFEEFFEPLNKFFAVRAFPSEQGLAVYFRDITEARRTAEALRASEAEFRTLSAAMPQIVWVTTPDGANIDINQQWVDYTGMSAEDSRGDGWLVPFHPGERAEAMQAWQRATATLGTYSMERRLRRADGEYRWWLMRGVPLLDADGAALKWIGTCTDIHDLKLAEQEISRTNAVLRESEHRVRRLNRVYAVLSRINALIVRKPERDVLFSEACRVAADVGGFRFAWIGTVDAAAGRITPIASAGEVSDFFEHAPPAIFEIASHSPSRAGQAVREQQSQTSNDFRHGQQLLMRQAMEARGIRSFAVLPFVVDGVPIGVLALYSGEPGFFDEEEMRLLQELVANICLAIEHIERQQRLDFLAYYDDLTGLANQSLFLDRVSQHVRAAAAGGQRLAVFLVDVERFKNINDSLGRVAGDTLLKQVAEWLGRRAGDASLVARVGVDVFAMVMPLVRPDGDLTRKMESTIAALAQHPFQLGDDVLQVAVKVGVALYPDDGDSADVLFRNAEAALKNAKAGGDRYLFHSKAMTESVAARLTMENQLRRALANGEFVLHFQPKIELKTGVVQGAEALIRWNDPRTGLVPPGRFIPVLEETGLIQDVGRWALRTAIDTGLQWHGRGVEAMRIAVNVSALQLRDRDFVAEIEALVHASPGAAAGLELEITESMIMSDLRHGIASLDAIRTLGITVALDDFGTGFSSLNHLARLPIDTLKIDGSFIADMTATPQGLALVSTIIGLAHALQHQVVAEGVETEEQSRLLRLMGCDAVQGYYFGRPVPAEVFASTYLRPVEGAT